METRAAIYCRISDDRTGEGAGVARQRADCEGLAERRGFTVEGVYTDNDLSASNGVHRPEYERMLADIEAGTIDVVLAWHPDRLHRRPIDLERFIDVVEAAGATVATVQAGDVDLSTPSGRMVARVIGAMARHEVELKGARQARKHEELARQGKPAGGGDRPFGYDDDRVTMNRAEAKLIREAVERIISGDSLRGIARDWAARGVLTPAGHEWRTTSLRRMLISARIAGLRSHKGVVTAEATWKGIIDHDTHERVRAVLSDPNRLKNGGALARRYLLTGFGFCGLCGSRLVARPRQDKARAYVCASGPNFGGCGKIRVLAVPLEDLVREAIFAALDGPEFAAALRAAESRTDDDAELLAALREDEEALEQASRDHYAERLIDRPTFLAAKTVLEERIRVTRRGLGRRARSSVLQGFGGDSAALRKRWDAGDLGWRRSVVGATLERVEVGPAVRGRNRFDPGRVRLIWRV